MKVSALLDHSACAARIVAAASSRARAGGATFKFSTTTKKYLQSSNVGRAPPR
jgi:hypothetical protein